MFTRTEPPSNVIKFPNLIESRNILSASEGHFDGPLGSKLWTLANSVPSTYQDTFNYGIYDQIADRYGEEQPRGGVVFNTTFKLASTQPGCSKCFYAFELDTYGRGCIHNCLYCYAKETLSAYGYWNRPVPFPVNVGEIRKTFATVFETTKRNQWRDVLERRVPIRLGSMSDPFMWMDQKYKVTYEILKILKHYNYPYIVFTRSDLVATDEYIQVLDSKLASIQFSIAGMDEKLTRQLEPGAPSFARRLAALKKLAEAGFWTTVRINPMFPSLPDGYFTNPDSVIERFGSLKSAPQFNLLDITKLGEFFDKLKEAHVPSVLAGIVRLSPHAIKAVSTATGINLKDFYSPEVLKQNSDKHYSQSEISHYYRLLHREAREKKVRFSTCYIGNGEADFYRHQDLWSNKSDCCDAKGNVDAFRASCHDLNINVEGGKAIPPSSPAVTEL